jgi:hypothetical protein
MRYYKVDIDGHHHGTVDVLPTEFLKDVLTRIREGSLESINVEQSDPHTVEAFIEQVEIELLARSLEVRFG